MGRKSRKKAQRKKAESRKEEGESPEVGSVYAPSPRHLVWQGVFVCILGYAITLLFRLLELSGWGNPAFHFQGQYLMATHDAYVWLAGAEELNRKTGSGLSGFLKFLHDLTGFNVANVGFWLPVIFAPLAALPLGVLAWFKKQPEAGVVCGIMSAGCLGFLLRTRVGFVDTDIFALFFPLAVAAGLIVWLSALCRNHWLRRKSVYPDISNRVLWFLLGAVGIGLLVQGYDFFYGKLQITLALIGVSFVLGLFLTPRQRYHTLVLGVAVLVSSSLGGWIGLILGLLACAVLLYRPEAWDKWSFIGVFAVLVLILCGGDLFSIFSSALEKTLSYAKISSSESSGTALDLPAILQSVREAQNVNWDAMVSRTAGNWWLFWLGVSGYIYLVFRRPVYLVWLPLLGLGIASVKLGNRFAMFGGSAFGLGIALGINRLLLDLKQPQWRRWIVQAGLCLFVLWPLWNAADSLRPSPILPKAYAKTFADLREKAPRDAQLWQWWDYGYAGQYFAHRRVFGDGGQHSGDYLYPLARVHATSSPLQAAQIMKFTLKTQMEQYREMEKNGSLSHTEAKAPNYPGDPVKKLREMGPEKASAFISSLKKKDREWPKDLPEQYFVLSWENFRLAYWITNYGTWDLVTGNSSPGKLQRVKGQVKIDSNKGKLHFKNGNAVPVDSADMITPQGTRRREWSNPGSVHLILNKLSKELYLMDDKVYNSLMVQMLIGNPARFEDNFELVVDHYPWNRAYRVK